MKLNIEWSSFLKDDIQLDYYKKLTKFVDAQYSQKTIFPDYKYIFNAFKLLNPLDVKVVILGQDPYHGINQAHGLAFSVLNECKTPPSLKNIFIELVDDIGCNKPLSPNLTLWAQEGILLINSVLTVQEGKANSHKNKGWEKFTDNVIRELSLKRDNIVFILWGNYAQKKAIYIDKSKHLIIMSPHPSPLSSYRGFFGSKPFSLTNKYLQSTGQKKINWCLN